MELRINDKVSHQLDSESEGRVNGVKCTNDEWHVKVLWSKGMNAGKRVIHDPDLLTKLSQVSFEVGDRVASRLVNDKGFVVEVITIEDNPAFYDVKWDKGYVTACRPENLRKLTETKEDTHATKDKQT